MSLKKSGEKHKAAKIDNSSSYLLVSYQIHSECCYSTRSLYSEYHVSNEMKYIAPFYKL